MTEHLLPITADRLLQFGVGFFWTITYIFIIYKGFRDRTCGMPFAALCANLSWEFLFSFIFPFEPLQLAINLLWLALDFIILCQFIYYSSESSPFGNSSYVIWLPTLALALLLNMGITLEFHDFEGKYSAFGINLMMSLLFIKMLTEQGLLGQSIFIAISKMAGTLCASLLFFSLYPKSVLLTLLYLLILILDIIYIIMIRYRSIKVVHRSNAAPVR
ncbi:MAG: hypothetical protein K0S39_111 [Paenibacillus sp.]|jgi:hypothetical protein|nr:hypothetical protein [Paenibacillus sp.]